MKLPVHQKGICCCHSERECWISTHKVCCFPSPFAHPSPIPSSFSSLKHDVFASVPSSHNSFLCCDAFIEHTSDAHRFNETALPTVVSLVGTCIATDLRRGAHAHEPDSAFCWLYVPPLHCDQLYLLSGSLLSVIVFFFPPCAFLRLRTCWFYSAIISCYQDGQSGAPLFICCCAFHIPIDIHKVISAADYMHRVMC